MAQCTLVSITTQESVHDKGERDGEQKNETEKKEETQIQTGQVHTPTPTTHNQGVTIITEEEKDTPKESNLTKKLEEQIEIQTLITLPKFSTPPS